MKEKSEYLEKAYIASRAGNHEEAAEYAMEGMRIAKRNGDTEFADALITMLNYTFTCLMSERNLLKKSDTSCSACGKNEDKVTIIGIAGILICNECNELISNTLKENL
jgi:hypothetical protein